MASHDILLPPAAAAASGISRSKLAAFVPIALALFGVGAVLLGGISARTSEANTAALSQIDPMTTGAIAQQDQRRALEMLDH
jgi:hypothetical protein